MPNENQTHHLFREAITAVKQFVTSVLKIEDTNVLGTIENVKKDMVFRGATAWILMFSILIASIGLNANSTAVIIGAMLISPLMGPIVAIGLSLGINDFDLLKRAIKNFIIAISISLITSSLYFWLTPLKENTSELLSRTSPTILDVFIALFGGFAGIIAGSRRERTNVIPGVAIATALMPPLCTAGYGIATWQLNYLFGALYLFFINSVFISIATVITVRLLKFPKIQFVDHDKERRIKLLMTIFAIIMIIPSLVIFINVIKKSRFNGNAKIFIHEVVKQPGSQLINSQFVFSDTTAEIKLYFIGKTVSDSSIRSWLFHLSDYGLIAKKNWFSRLMLPDTTVLQIYQSSNDAMTQQEFHKLNQSLKQEIRIGVLEDIYKKNEQIIEQKDKEINKLLKELNRFKKNQIPVNQLYKELNVQYPRITSFAYAQSIKYINDTLTDTIPTFIISWKKGTSLYYIKRKEKVLSKWLKIRFKLDTLSLIHQ